MANRQQKAAPPTRRRLVKLTAVAEVLDVSIDSVDRYVSAGKIPVVRLPSGVRRVDQEVLNALIEDWKAESR